MCDGGGDEFSMRKQNRKKEKIERTQYKNRSRRGRGRRRREGGRGRKKKRGSSSSQQAQWRRKTTHTIDTTQRRGSQQHTPRRRRRHRSQQQPTNSRWAGMVAGYHRCLWREGTGFLLRFQKKGGGVGTRTETGRRGGTEQEEKRGKEHLSRPLYASSSSSSSGSSSPSGSSPSSS